MKTNSVYGDAIAPRINYAARCIMSGHTGGRSFDTCFEMGDGDEVVAALVKRARRNPRLAAKLKGVISESSLRKFGGDFLFPNPMTTTDEGGQTVRGFEVIVFARQGRLLRYPCSNAPLLTGPNALILMEQMRLRGYRTQAQTDGSGGPEKLTLDEMRDIFRDWPKTVLSHPMQQPKPKSRAIDRAAGHPELFPA